MVGTHTEFVTCMGVSGGGGVGGPTEVGRYPRPPGGRIQLPPPPPPVPISRNDDCDRTSCATFMKTIHDVVKLCACVRSKAVFGNSRSFSVQK